MPKCNTAVEEISGDSAVYVTPGASPALRIVLEGDAPDDIQQVALRYWSLELDGAWSNRVADLGPAEWVARTVRDKSRVVLLGLGCTGCGEMPSARSRSQVASLTSARHNTALCLTCLSLPPEAVPLSGAQPAQEEHGEGDHDDSEPGPVAQGGSDDAALPEALAEKPCVELEVIEGVPEALVAIARQYWDLSHFDPETGEPVWSGPVRSIDVTGWGAPQIAAGAAVWARVPGRSCPSCDGPLSLTSRTAFVQACLGEPSPCVDCTPGFAAKLAKRRDTALAVPPPTRSADVKVPGKRRKVEADARARWSKQQEDTIRSNYAVRFHPQIPPPDSDVRTEATALALLGYAPSTTPIAPLRSWGTPLDPDVSRTPVGELLMNGLVRIHPDSSPEAFCWAPESFSAAVAEKNNEECSVPEPQLTDGYYSREAAHYVPYGTSMGTGAENLAQHLTVRLALDGFDDERQEQLLALVQELIAAEALRYLDTQLGKRHLPPVPDTHLGRLKDFTLHGSEVFTLGELNNLVWRAARSAADAAQRNPQAPRVNMSVFAVNCLETYLQQTSSAGEERQPIRPYTFDPSNLAALTRTVFYTVLKTDPFTTGVVQAAAALPSPMPRKSAQEEQDSEGVVPHPRTPVVRSAENTTDAPGGAFYPWLDVHRSQWDPDDFVKNLLYLRAQALSPQPTEEERQQARAAEQMDTLHRKLRAVLSTPHDAVLATCVASQHLLAETEGHAVQAVIQGFEDRVMASEPSPEG
ncbi:hypothetical protein [Streptomyces anulatus]|uniref:hypothetical protein n=1 Tax=Streptomyces anulatus TaxID=1892 RepID=UPI00344192EE